MKKFLNFDFIYTRKIEYLLNFGQKIRFYKWNSEKSPISIAQFWPHTKVCHVLTVLPSLGGGGSVVCWYSDGTLLRLYNFWTALLLMRNTNCAAGEKFWNFALFFNISNAISMNFNEISCLSPVIKATKPASPSPSLSLRFRKVPRLVFSPGPSRLVLSL